MYPSKNIWLFINIDEELTTFLDVAGAPLWLMQSGLDFEQLLHFAEILIWGLQNKLPLQMGSDWPAVYFLKKLHGFP